MAHTTRQNGFAIRDFRVAAKLSPDELAQRLNISTPHLRNLENEHREATEVLIRKIADTLLCRPQSLVRDPAALVSTERAA